MAEGGTVLSIHRGSVHDGPGLRTTVFLKGCPLRCAWCHNPESQAAAPQLAFRRDRCVDCGACVVDCPQAAHRLVDGRHQHDRERCTACGICAGICAHDALECYGRRMSVDEVMAPVLADRPFYRGGGGLTLSGGEPLAQPAFSAAVLSAARAAGIHTCLETCGHAGAEAVGMVLPHVDLVLFDRKASDDATHRRLTGVGLERIEATFARILALRIPVVLRAPLVPGWNDDAHHLAALADLSRRHGLPLEIMPYHPLGRAKAAAIGEPQSALPTRGASAEQVSAWRGALASAGASFA